MDFEIPPGLTNLLEDFTVSVLREKPEDLVDFAVDYFVEMQRSGQCTRKQISFQTDEVMRDEEPMQTASDEDDEPMEPPPMMNRYARRKSVAAEKYDPEAEDDDDEKEQLEEVMDAMFDMKVKPDDHIIDQGDDGDNFYVIQSGTYDIFVKTDVGDKCVGGYAGSGSFGELALMYNMPRAATIVATSEGSLWAMNRTTFRRILMKSAFKKRKMYEALLEGVPMLQTLEKYERMNLADALQPLSFDEDIAIIKQGDSADGMYFIESGTVCISVRNEANEDQEVTRLSRGQYFGELALVTQKPRAATATSVEAVKLAYLERQAFERLLGPCMDLMKRNVSLYEDQLVKLFGSQTNISES
ncbi:PREDICTED: cAMP-dependent protein kinase type II regulatory subunit-like isoform X2 [Priapulus caudatus]|uniref:cAMP-dependent protein kinase type II regulatory subunit-like isoform X2 n=1 Tax=Priapulus caudatus TaxID=37621 RepID=A0ABM1EMF1_PRICU|nr:PREDICTED: cAMP-dependent protein kinase type II regulatory subunit-like isoform X2 [Priapulus caudatus]